MKKGIILFIVVAFFLTGCVLENKKVTNDEKNFKEEYESLNGKKNGDHEYLTISIPKNNKMEYVTSKEVVQILKRKTGIIYFGFPQCPWCRSMISTLIDSLEDSSINKIYYANLLDERDSKKLEDGEIITEKEGSRSYYEILEILKDELGSYEGLEDESIKRLYFPTVVFVKQGKIEKVHIGTLDSQKDPYKGLNEKQKKQLKNIFIKNIKKIENITCDKKNSC